MSPGPWSSRGFDRLQPVLPRRRLKEKPFLLMNRESSCLNRKRQAVRELGIESMRIRKLSRDPAEPGAGKSHAEICEENPE